MLDTNAKLSKTRDPVYILDPEAVRKHNALNGPHVRPRAADRLQIDLIAPAPMIRLIVPARRRGAVCGRWPIDTGKDGVRRHHVAKRHGQHGVGLRDRICKFILIAFEPRDVEV